MSMRDWTGVVVGRLRVLEQVGTHRYTSPRGEKTTWAMWRCVCACGAELTCSSVRLRVAVSVGANSACDACLRKDRAADLLVSKRRWRQEQAAARRAHIANELRRMKAANAAGARNGSLLRDRAR